ncbi:glycosyltransferase [Cryobacterium sp. TMT4-10]|uniref:CgeB family protein n=1 Tax=Cryobacterium sp. TMT4-10 TaxID=1259256 RepID=UPI00141A7D43|nr:glycosyltransferase [Cryobacterium sp. TMT4-10]
MANLISILGDRLPRQDALLQRHLIAQERDFKPDVILTTDRTIQPAVVRELRSGGAKIALWFPDHVSNMGRHDLFLAGYDRIFFKNPVLVRQLTSIHGVAATYMPEACNPSWHRPDADYGTVEEIALVGNVHPTRALLLDRMVRAGLPLRIYGPRLARWIDLPALESVHSGMSVHREQKARTFRSARVVLNNLHPGEYAGVNCRLFEAAGSGAAALTESREGLSDLFDEGNEVMTFASFDELVEKCNFLLSNRAAGAAMGDAAARRAHRDHTYDVRLPTLLGSL